VLLASGVLPAALLAVTLNLFLPQAPSTATRRVAH